MDGHWTEGLEHTSITDANREAFNTAMAKYTTPTEAAVGGFNAMTKTGVNFKLPKSVESLPDEAMRKDFTSQVNKLFGREFAADTEALSVLDMKSGASDDAKTSEEFVAAFKQFVVEKHIAKSDAQTLITFFNESTGKALTKFAEDKAAFDIAADTTCKDALIAHFGSQENVDKQDILMHRALIGKHIGLSVGEAAEVAETIKGSNAMKNPLLRRVMYKALGPLAAESSTEGGLDTKVVDKVADPEEGSPTYKAFGWSPDDKK